MIPMLLGGTQYHTPRLGTTEAGVNTRDLDTSALSALLTPIVPLSKPPKWYFASQKISFDDGT